MVAKLNSNMELLIKTTFILFRRVVKLIRDYHSFEWIYYPNGTTEHKTQRYYRQYGLSFRSYGDSDSCDDGNAKQDISFESCIVFCVEQRSKHGEAYLAYCSTVYDVDRVFPLTTYNHQSIINQS